MSPNRWVGGGPRAHRDGGVVSRGVVLLLAALGLVGWIVWDLAAPRRVDIRSFDPVAVGRLDTAMWRSYYDRRPIRLFLQASELMREQFHFPLLRSYVAAFRAARSAFVFKRGHDRADYRRALPDLLAYYAAIRAMSATPFDVRRTAELELEWWIVHRERLRRRPGDLEDALADAAAELYRVPAERMANYARHRTLAMVIRDVRAASGKLTEGEWNRIEGHLIAAWRSLHDVIHQPLQAQR